MEAAIILTAIAFIVFLVINYVMKHFETPGDN